MVSVSSQTVQFREYKRAEKFMILELPDTKFQPKWALIPNSSTKNTSPIHGKEGSTNICHTFIIVTT